MTPDRRPSRLRHHLCRARRPLLAALAALALTGCAGVFRVDSSVQSFARWGDATGLSQAGTIPAAPQQYRFDRPPSQLEGEPAAAQDRLEALTRQALEPLGWQAATDGASARWAVQVSASTLRQPRAPWDDPWGHPWPGWQLGGQIVGQRGQVVLAPMLMLPMDRPYFMRQVALLIRDTASGRIVYETRAEHDGRWNGTPALWRALLDAALRDFPAPPPGVRQVHTDLPR